MKNKQKLSAFDRLFNEAIEDENLFGDEEEFEVTDDGVDFGDEEDFESSEDDVTITIPRDIAKTLCDILSTVIDTEETLDDLELGRGEEEEEDISDIEELERESVESESAPTPKSAKDRTKKGTVVDQRGDLKREQQTHDGEEKQYKFTPKKKPTELKHKVTGHKKGS